MSPVVTDNRDRSRFEIRVDGSLAGFSRYRLHGDTIELIHTEIDDAFSGQGLGKVLAAGVLDAARGAGLAVVPRCPFIAGYIKRNPDYVDLVPEDRRAEFGL